MVQCIEICMCRLWTMRKEETRAISNRVLDRMTDWGSLLSNLCLWTTRETIYNCVLFPFLSFSFSFCSLLRWSDIEHENRSPLVHHSSIFRFLSFLFVLRSTLFACLATGNTILIIPFLSFVSSFLLIIVLGIASTWPQLALSLYFSQSRRLMHGWWSRTEKRTDRLPFSRRKVTKYNDSNHSFREKNFH